MVLSPRDVVAQMSFSKNSNRVDQNKKKHTTSAAASSSTSDDDIPQKDRRRQQHEHDPSQRQQSSPSPSRSSSSSSSSSSTSLEPFAQPPAAPPPPPPPTPPQQHQQRRRQVSPSSSRVGSSECNDRTTNDSRGGGVGNANNSNNININGGGGGSGSGNPQRHCDYSHSAQVDERDERQFNPFASSYQNDARYRDSSASGGDGIRKGTPPVSNHDYYYYAAAGGGATGAPSPAATATATATATAAAAAPPVIRNYYGGTSTAAATANGEAGHSSRQRQQQRSEEEEDQEGREDDPLLSDRNLYLGRGNAQLRPNLPGLTNSYADALFGLALHEILEKLRLANVVVSAATLLSLLGAWFWRLFAFRWCALVLSTYLAAASAALLAVEVSSILRNDVSAARRFQNAVRENLGCLCHPVGKAAYVVALSSLCWSLGSLSEQVLGSLYFVAAAVHALAWCKYPEWRKMYDRDDGDYYRGRSLDGRSERSGAAAADRSATATASWSEYAASTASAAVTSWNSSNWSTYRASSFPVGGGGGGTTTTGGGGAVNGTTATTSERDSLLAATAAVAGAS